MRRDTWLCLFLTMMFSNSHLHLQGGICLPEWSLSFSMVICYFSLVLSNIVTNISKVIQKVSGNEFKVCFQRIFLCLSLEEKKNP